VGSELRGLSRKAAARTCSRVDWLAAPSGVCGTAAVVGRLARRVLPCVGQAGAAAVRESVRARVRESVVVSLVVCCCGVLDGTG
jgi:hypothetical protein